MTKIALLFMYESWRSPRRIRDTDCLRNAACVINGRVFAGVSWRAPR